MKLTELSEAAKEQIGRLRYDRIVDKHEGPEPWDAVLRHHDPEFFEISGRSALLPIGRDRHPNVTILRSSVSSDEQSMVVFLKDTTFVDDPGDEHWASGFLAICERLPGQSFYVASVYHEWFLLPAFNQQ